MGLILAHESRGTFLFLLKKERKIENLGILNQAIRKARKDTQKTAPYVAQTIATARAQMCKHVAE